MIVGLRKKVAIMTLALVLGLAGLGGFAHLAASPLQHHTQTHSSQMRADNPLYVCPAPPFYCG